jgi:hypothetical protein
MLVSKARRMGLQIVDRPGHWNQGIDHLFTI